MSYNLWIKAANRWTSEPYYDSINGIGQDPNDPIPLTLECAKDWMIRLTGFDTDPTGYFEIRPLPSQATTLSTIPVATVQLTNDHTCPTCKNTRVSKLEKSCWLC